MKKSHGALRKSATNCAVGGPIKGKGTGTSDDVPIMASNGEFMIKAKAAKVIGPEVLEALNEIADKPDEKDSKSEAMREYGKGSESETHEAAEDAVEGMKCGGAIKKMSEGGPVKKYEDDLAQAQALAAARASGASLTPSQESSNTQSYLSANQAANDMQPTTPFLKQAKTDAGVAASGALQSAYGTPTPMPQPVAAPTPAPQGTPAAAVQPAGALPRYSPAMDSQKANLPVQGGDIPTPTDPVKAPPMLNGQAGKDVGYGATRFDVPGKSPLFTNMTDSAGMASNTALANRGAISPENQGALDGIQARQDAGDRGRAVKSQYDAEVAGAQAINEAGRRMNLEYDLKNGNAKEREAAKLILQGIDSTEKDKRSNSLATRGQDITAQAQAVQAGALRANQKLAQDKFVLEQAKDSRDSTSASLDHKARQQLFDAQQEMLNAGDDPVKQKAAERKLMALGNRQPQNDQYAYAPGGQVIDPTTGQTVTQAGVIFNKATGQTVQQGQQMKSAPPAKALEMLKANPKLAAEFDAKYGPGASAQYLAKK